MTCATSERPSTAYCPLLSPTDEAICQNQIDILQDALDSALDVAESNAADEWDTYFWLLEQMDESGVSLFNNADFLEWVYDHDADNWYCGFDTTQTWDPATQTTLDVDGNVVTDSSQVCYTGQDPSLDLTKNARTQTLLATDFSTTATTTTSATPVVAAAHPVVGQTDQCVFDNSINDYICAPGCYWDYNNSVEVCESADAYTSTSYDPVLDLAYAIGDAVFPLGYANGNSTEREILVGLMSSVTWLTNDITVDVTNTGPANMENLGVIITGADPFQTAGFTLDGIDMDTLIEIANCVHAAQLQDAATLTATVGTMDLVSEAGTIVYDLNYDEAVAGAVPDLTALDLSSWATQAVESLTWVNYDYTISAFDTAQLGSQILGALSGVGIDTSNIDEALIQQYAYRFVDTVLYRDCALEQLAIDYDDYTPDVSLHPVIDLLTEIEWALLPGSTVDTSQLDEHAIVGAFVQGMLTTDANGVVSVIAADDGGISNIAYATAEAILGQTPTTDLGYDAASIDTAVLHQVADCYYNSFAAGLTVWEERVYQYPLENIIIDLGIEWGYDSTALETGVYQFSAEIPTWVSQALASLSWDNMVYTIGDLQAVR